MVVKAGPTWPVDLRFPADNVAPTAKLDGHGPTPEAVILLRLSSSWEAGDGRRKPPQENCNDRVSRRAAHGSLATLSQAPADTMATTPSVTWAQVARS